MKEEMPAVSAKDISFRYYKKGKRSILDHVSIEIPAGKITVLAGSSGCGKSTLGLVLSGLLPENGGFLESGEIRLFGQDIRGLKASERARLFGIMFQNPDLQFCMDSLRRELIFCLENLGTAPEDMDRRVEEAALAFKLEGLLDRKLQSLSGGEKQKCILACLYAMDTRCLFLDEPFANIDPDSAGEILAFLSRLREEGRSIIAIDHRLDCWLPYADEIRIMGEGGKILAEGIDRDNFRSYREVFLREGIYYPGEEEASIKAGEEGESGAKRIPGSEAGENYEPEAGEKAETETEPGSASDPVTDLAMGEDCEPGSDGNYAVSIDIKRLYRREEDRGKTSGRKPLTEDLRLSFKKGSVNAIMGRSGVGKTSLLLAILRQCPFEGEISIAGKNLRAYRSRELYSKLGIVFQNPADQFISQRVEDEVKESLRHQSPRLSEESLEDKALELLESYGLRRFKNYSPFMLSQGQQRRLAVLSMLAGGQKILLLDEPTYGQDYRSTKAIMDQLKDKASREGLTVIFTTHDAMVAARWADKIIHISSEEDGAPEDPGETSDAMSAEGETAEAEAAEAAAKVEARLLEGSASAEAASAEAAKPREASNCGGYHKIFGFASLLNPSVKAVTVLILALILAFQYNTELNISVFACCMALTLFFSGKRRPGEFKILIPAVIAAAGMFFMGLYFSRGQSITDALGEGGGHAAISYAVQTAAAGNLGNALALGSRILAYAGLGIFFVLSTEPEEFVTSLIKQLKLPVKFGYGILAALHMVPDIRREYDVIRLAFRIRGVPVRALSAKAVFVMLVNCIRRSDNVAMAMESKGFSGEDDRSCYSQPKVRARDLIFALASIAAVIAASVLGG
ncbi:MAG: ATP-binding cassette domain-containing protein [Candidatus Avilachnospira sp.]